MNMDYRTICWLIIMKFAFAHQDLSPSAKRQQALYIHSLLYYPAHQHLRAQKAASSKPNSSITELPTSVTSTNTTTAPPISSFHVVSNSKHNSSTAYDSNKQASENITSNLTVHTLEVSTDNTIYTPVEFPHELLEIARSKLGLKTLDEVPSISELAEFLGTVNTEETLKYIRRLTSTEEGVTLIKKYLESADFTNRTEETRRRHQQQETNVKSALVESKKAKSNLLQRVAAYFHIYNLWPQKDGETDEADIRKQVQQQLTKYIKPQLEYRKRMQVTAAHKAGSYAAATPHQIPLLVRNPLPYHYPIPLRPLLSARLPQNNNVTDNTLSQSAAFSPVHLNTPRFYLPSHIQLARATNIPPQQLQTLLQSKPKLAELAAKVSHLPLTNDRSALIDAQLLAAVKRAVEQDDDLRKLLQTTAETLK
ncbi:uncharacterized protein LOC129244827 [Anastrepha obliqua]|uniref:uncharacterized protein LOC129244827 n=1 Tax=Anastrepha obliqua TaxID=95512 RepID=UPI002409BC77|nr:uncharacterized protein LOC129244827 [Anastrepha obliqua]